MADHTPADRPPLWRALQAADASCASATVAPAKWPIGLMELATMPELSPAALHVWDAFSNIVEAHGPPRLGIAAALRAAALYSYCPVDRRILATIADELENNG